MNPPKPLKWLTAAGVIAGLALPSVGTFYALRLQYPSDPLILGLAITSWFLIGMAGLLGMIGIGLWASRIWSQKQERKRIWATDGGSARGTIDYLTAIAKRETETFIALEAEEQKWREGNPGKTGRHLENAQRLLKQSEMIQARKDLAESKRNFLRIAPRAARREALKEWSQCETGSIRRT